MKQRERNPKQRKRLQQASLRERPGIDRFKAEFLHQRLGHPLGVRVVTANRTSGAGSDQIRD
jgi:hypothetical protein